METANISRLENILGVKFNNRSILFNALTHSSFANEMKKGRSYCNERLEFLGDSILGMIVARYLFSNYPDMPEGQMTRLRAELVCEKSLFKAASAIELGSFLRLGHGEEQGGGRERPSILADAFEAVLAAVYLDQGQKAVENIINKYILSSIKTDDFSDRRDYKTELQELLQRNGTQSIKYELVGEHGPDHDKIFIACVCLNGKKIGEGSGKNKKTAEQMAAKNAMEEMQ